MNNPLTYKDSGVDLELYQQAMDRIPGLVKKTHGPRVMPLQGGFAGLFQLNGDSKKYDDPVLISGTDGVGTKIKVAQHAQRYNTIGIDLVAMCVNDCLCLGAEPLFFLDYLALGKDDPALIASLVEGVSTGCEQAGAALIGGETAIMPDLYANDDFDMAGFCVGVVEKDKMIDGSKIQAGDALIGIGSAGIHSNGYSLVRKIVFETAKLDITDTVEELGTTVGEALLQPTKIYSKIINVLTNCKTHSPSLHGIAHITGGGLAENLERIFPENCKAEIARNSWTTPAVFNWLQKLGPVAEEEMLRVFNMGIGLVLVVDAKHADAIASKMESLGETVFRLGQVESGERTVKVV